MIKHCLQLIAVLMLIGCQNNTHEISSDSGKIRPGEVSNCFPEGTYEQVFFAYDSAVLSPNAQQTLSIQAGWFKRNPNGMAVIEGHADERGTREYNLALGERRATAVKNYLVASGVDASRIDTVSYGKERPAILGSTEDIFAQNRRARTVIEKAKENRP